jgi:alpha-D-xyloside xylohydrolase
MKQRIHFPLLALLLCLAHPARADVVTVWLDELDLSQMKQEVLRPKAKQSFGGEIMSIGGGKFARGIGSHANSSLTLDLQGKGQRLIASVGADEGKKTNPGSVEFLVVGDGKTLWKSGVMKGGEPAKRVDVELGGVKRLELRATDGGDGVDSDHADWADARILANEALPHLYPDGTDATIPTAEWNKLSSEQLARRYELEAVGPGIWRLRLGQPEQFTPEHFRAQPARTAELAGLASCPRLPVKVASIGFKTTGRGCVLELPLQSGERIYGLGMNLKVFDPMNGRRTMRVSDDQGTVLGDSHAPVPFYVSTRGYGVYVDSARYVSFYGGNLDPVREAQGRQKGAAAGDQIPSTSVEALYRPRELADKVMTMDLPVARGVDLYIFGGPDLRQSVQRYNLFSGGGCMPPLWGLGVWYRASTELGQREVLGFLREFRERHIPCDVFGLEPGWHSHAYSCSFVWGKNYPDPGALLDEATARNYKLNLWEHAFVHPTSPLYQPLLPWSGDYKVWNGLVPDFATAEARALFAGHHNKLLVSKGVSGFKLDECDHQPLSATPWSFPECSRFPSGLDGEQMHLLIGSLYQQTLLEPYRQRNQRTFGLVRSSGALAAPLPYVLYSDAYDHRDYVRALATSGFAGVLWCPEVRDMASLEEFYRRLETSVFSALTQIDCWYLKNPVWKQINKDMNNRGQFMTNWEQTEAVCRRLLDLRMSLLPYLYSAYADYRNKGLPPVRAVVMDYPEDGNAWGVDDEYLFGASLLVAPLFTGQTARSVYLPEGDWYDFWTHEKYAGGRKVEVTKPLDQIPVFVKGGTLLPLAEPVECVTPATEFALTVHAFGTKPVPFVLYEDDGVTFNFEQNQQNRIELGWDGQTGHTTKTGNYRGPSRFKFVRWTKAGN